MRRNIVFIVLSNAAGEVARMHLVTTARLSEFSPDAALNSGFLLSEDGLWQREATPELINREVARMERTPFGRVVGWRIVEAKEFPTQHHDYRSAWRDTGTKIEVDMPKARELHREKLRQLRAPKLVALDIEQKKALVKKDDVKVAEIEAKLQALRDVTDDPRIAAATTPKELKVVVPTILTEGVRG